MTSTRCRCGVQTNYGITCVRCRQETYRSRYTPIPKIEPAETVAPVEEAETEEDEDAD